MKKICLVCVFLLCISQSICGEEGYAFKELYEVQVELKGTDRVSINEGMKLAFQNLMLTLSSNSEINTYPAVTKAVKDSEKYISEYRLHQKMTVFWLSSLLMVKKLENFYQKIVCHYG